MSKINKWIKNTFLTSTKKGKKLKLKSVVAIPLLVLVMAGISFKWFYQKNIDTEDFAIIIPAVFALFYRKNKSP